MTQKTEGCGGRAVRTLVQRLESLQRAGVTHLGKVPRAELAPPPMAGPARDQAETDQPAAALTNVARHAQASRVRLHLAHRPSSILALVEDDGRGFDPEEVATREASGYGLQPSGTQLESRARSPMPFRVERRQADPPDRNELAEWLRQDRDWERCCLRLG